MAKMKFDLQEIVNNVKAMISPVNIPESEQSEPVAYLLGELNKVTKEMADLSAKQSDAVAKLNNLLGTLYQQTVGSVKTTVEPAEKTEHTDTEKK